MQSKEKRKTNPRRRLLMRLIVGIIAIGIVTILGLRALQPTGAQIVYIAPDDNGYDAIWLADLNDPEHPRQLTHHEGMFIRDFQVSQENSIIFYSISSSTGMDFWLINLDTNEQTNMPLCETEVCSYFMLQSDGEWISFQEFSSDYERVIEIIVQNLETLERRTLFDMVQPSSPHLQPLPHWIGNTDRLAFRIGGSERDLGDDEFAFYSIEEDQIIDVKLLNVSFWSLNFSDDGSLFNYYLNYRDIESIWINIRYLDNSSNLIYETGDDTYFLDWHPDNENILVLEDNLSNTSTLELYNLVIGEAEILTTLSLPYFYARFNYDASQILATAFIPDSQLRQFMLFDMETREEITLPIVGRSPQWANGGR